MRAFAPALALLLLAGGCDLVQVKADADQLYARGRIAVGRNLDFRDWIRQECIAIVKETVTEARREPDNHRAREILVEAMPRLLTVATVEALIDGKEDGELDLSAWDVTYCETLDPPAPSGAAIDQPP